MPNNVTNPTAHLQFIKEKAANLLHNSLYLEGEHDHQVSCPHDILSAINYWLSTGKCSPLRPPHAQDHLFGCFLLQFIRVTPQIPWISNHHSQDHYSPSCSLHMHLLLISTFHWWNFNRSTLYPWYGRTMVEITTKHSTLTLSKQHTRNYWKTSIGSWGLPAITWGSKRCWRNGLQPECKC